MGLGLVWDGKGKFVVGLSFRLVSSRSVYVGVKIWMRVGLGLGEWVYSGFRVGLGWI